MAMVDEGEMMRSIDEVDAERTRERKAAAKQVLDLGAQHDKLMEQVNDVAQQLRQAVTSARKLFDGLEELAVHTKRTLPELTGWAEGHDSKATGRNKPSNRVGVVGRASHRGRATTSGLVADATQRSSATGDFPPTDAVSVTG